MKLNWIFLGGVGGKGVQNKNLFHWWSTFSGTTHYSFLDNDAPGLTVWGVGGRGWRGELM